MKVRITITLKPGVLDPQGMAIEGALHGLGFPGASNVRQGKYIELDLEASDAATAKKQAEEMCSRLLANMVIENYAIHID